MLHRFTVQRIDLYPIRAEQIKTVVLFIRLHTGNETAELSRPLPKRNQGLYKMPLPVEQNNPLLLYRKDINVFIRNGIICDPIY